MELISGEYLEGMSAHKLLPHTDGRGTFTEYFKHSWSSCVSPAQWAIVHSEKGVVRGAHLHLRHDEYFAIVSGVAYVGLYDVRRVSPTKGKHALFRLSSSAPAALTFPPGIVHAWCFPEGPAVHLQAVSEEYESYGIDDNHGCQWDDPDLGIPWPDFEAQISPRAANFPNLKTLKRSLDQFRQNR